MLRSKHRIYWSRQQFSIIKDLLRDDEAFVKTRYGRKPRTPPPPRLSREEKYMVNAHTYAGIQRISGQWVALQHQLGKNPMDCSRKTMYGHAESYGGMLWVYSLLLCSHRGYRQWNIRSVLGKFLVYETLTDNNDLPNTVLPSPANEAPSSSLPNKLAKFSTPTQKSMVPGLVAGKGALVYDAIYETVRVYGWSVETVNTLEKLKPAVTHAHQVCVVLKKLRSNPSLCLELFIWAKSIPGFRHDIVSYSTMMMILGDNGNYRTAEHLFIEMQELGLTMDTFAINHMIRCYLKANHFEDALDLYSKMPYFRCQPDNCTFGLLIDFCGKFGGKKELQRLFLDLRSSPHKADEKTFNSMISNFSRRYDYTNAREAAVQMRKWGIPYSCPTYAILIRMHTKAGEFQTAQELYVEYRTSGLEPNLIVYNTAVYSYGLAGDLVKAGQVIYEIIEAGLTPDRYTYCSVISSCMKAKQAIKARNWLDKAVESGNVSVEMCNAVIDGYLKDRQLEAAKELLTVLIPSWGLKPTLETYTVLMRHYTTSLRNDSKLVRDLMAETGESSIEEFVNNVLERLCPLSELKKRSRKLFSKLRQELNPRWARSFADVFVNHLHVFGYVREAYYVWEGVLSSELYPRGIWEDWQDAWFIWLQNMSQGTAMVGLTSGLIKSRKKLKQGFNRPERVIIVCGYSTERSKGVTHTVNCALVALNSPFEVFISKGRFMCEGNLFRDWLMEDQVVRELNLI